MLKPSVRAATRILLSIPHMGGNEIKYVQDAFETNWLSTTGPNLAALEKMFSALVGLPCFALSSCTAGIHLGLKLLGLKSSDEVILPTLTFVASCNPVLYERGIPVFIDSERESWNLDPQLLADFLKKRAAVNRLPKIVMAVHLFGQSADLEAILEICRRFELPLLEDAAESLGAKYHGKPVGTFGDVGVYSFNGNKIITSTGGGMLVSPREDYVEKALHWATQACEPGSKNYVHSELGYNYRLSNVLACIALGQLEVLEERVQQRRAVFQRYAEAFQGIPGIEPQAEVDFGMPNAECRMPSSESDPAKREEGAISNPKSQIQNPKSDDHSTLGTQPSTVNAQPASRHTHWLSCFLIDETKFGLSQVELIQFLEAANIDSRPVWKPMHTQKLYQSYECIGGEVAEDLNERGLCLPSSSSLSMEDQQFVIDRIREAHDKAR